MSISCCDFSEEIGDGISSESDLSAADEDAESETVVSAVCDVNIQPSPSVNLTGTSDVVTGNTTSVNLTNDSAGLHTETNNMMTYSESDSCSCSSCCCSCEECCNHESDSDVYMCYDSDSDTSSGEDTTDLDYDGDDEDDDGSMKCQPAARISNHYSNKILRLIRVQNVGLVVMAISKDSVSGRKSMEASSSLQMRMLKNLGKEIYFKRVPC